MTRAEKRRRDRAENDRSKKDDDRYMKNGGLCVLSLILPVIDKLLRFL